MKGLFLPTNGVGDGSAEYTDAELAQWLRNLLGGGSGVFAGIGDELEVSGSSSPLTCEDGAGSVYGYPFHDAASQSIAVPTPTVGTTGHRIVVRLDVAANTIRRTLLSSTDGVASLPALTQTPGSVYEIPLAGLTITTGGVITVTDEREWLRYATRVDEAHLDSSVAGNGLVGGEGSALAVAVDDATIEISSDALRVKAGGIGASHLGSGAVGTGALAALAADAQKVGRGVPRLVQRRGGDAQHWDTAGGAGPPAGGNAYITAPDGVAAGVEINTQVGPVDITVTTGNTFATLTISYPYGPYAYRPLVKTWLIDTGGEFCIVEGKPNAASPTAQLDVTVRFPSAVGSDKTIRVGWEVVGEDNWP